MTDQRTSLAGRLATYQDLLDKRLHGLVTERGPQGRLNGMMAYHLGWQDQRFEPCNGADPGKRLRPAVCLLVCESLCGASAPALPAATAVELAHNFSLVHDDIQDRSPLRRHRRTVWSVWGVADGINVGDGLFSLAQLALVDAEVPPDLAGAAIRSLNQACLAMCEGQTLDLQLEAAPQVSSGRYLAMIRAKTGALFGCAAELGARFGGGPAEVAEAMRRVGQALGEAYQMADDLIGVWGEDSATGKPTSDVRHRKRGLPAVLAWETATGPDRARLHGLYTRSRSLTEPEVAWVGRLFDQLGVRGEATRMVRTRLRQVGALVRDGLPAGEAREDLLALVAQVPVPR